MLGQDKKFNKRLEREIRNHINRYVEKYDEAVKKAGGKLSLDLLEYKIATNEGDRNLIIDRDLLGDYLSLKVAESNNRLQLMVGIFVAVSVVLTFVQVAKLLNWIT